MSTSAEDIPHRAAGGSEHHPMEAHAGNGVDLQDELAQLRQVTARYHDLDAALDAGYVLGWVNGAGTRIITGCIADLTAGQWATTTSTSS